MSESVRDFETDTTAGSPGVSASSALETAGRPQSGSPGRYETATAAPAEKSEPRITTLQWGIGVFCAFIAALILVAPHQFGGLFWSGLGEHLVWVGAFYLVVASALFGSVLLGAPRRWVLVCHFAASSTPLAFVYNSLVIGVVSGGAFNLTLAVGSALALFVPGVERAGRLRSGYLFALVFGAVIAVLGLIQLLLPGQFSSPVWSPVRPYLWLYGGGFLVTGVALSFVQFRPRLPAAIVWTAHLAVLVPSTAYALAVSIPSVAWVSILFFCGFSPLVASLPWTGPRLRRLDPRSFSVRLAFALALAAALPLILAMALLTAQQERMVRAEAEASQKALAVALASDVSKYVGSYRSSLTALAGYPGVLTLPLSEQHAVLRSFIRAFPNGITYGTYDATGKELARSDDRPPTSIAGRDVFEDARRTNGPSVYVAVSANYGVPVFGFGEPVRDADGKFVGMVGNALASSQLAAILNQARPAPGSPVYLVDASGRAIAHPNQSLVATFAVLSATPAVATALASLDESGVASPEGAGGELIVAFARVPDLGWFVLVERPTSDALATVRNGRDASFGLLLIGIVLAVVAGTWLSRRLTAPLAIMARASGELAQGSVASSLPRGGTSEIRALVAAFGEMRDRLIARTAEREQLLLEVQRHAAELNTANKKLDATNKDLSAANKELEAFTYSVAHDLRSPVGHRDGFSKVLLQDYGDKLDERGHQHLQFVREGSVKMGQLIDDLLGLTRVTRGELLRTAVDLSEIARSVAAELRAEQPERRIDLVIAPQLVAKGDLGLLRVVLENLLGNAWKFTSKRESARVEFDAVQQDGEAVYCVRDDGVGFDMVYADKLFRAFERLHSADEFPGTGIGLATVERIVRRHGGRVWAEAEVNKGAKFYFTLGC
ncbi:MAG: HAMP domain-containing protein [Chloroflexi bacterium]|nr:HAMP domain-containing protein [Chloroflexota bacterium]